VLQDVGVTQRSSVSPEETGARHPVPSVFGADPVTCASSLPALRLSQVCCVFGSSGRTRSLCALCSECTGLKSEAALKPDLLMEARLADLQDLQASRKPCDCNKVNSRKWFCLVREVSFCDECNEDHKKARVNSKHQDKVVTLAAAVSSGPLKCLQTRPHAGAVL
jgi:hypothetical protein